MKAASQNDLSRQNAARNSRPQPRSGVGRAAVDAGFIRALLKEPDAELSASPSN
jgi:hypothetical protein